MLFIAAAGLVGCERADLKPPTEYTGPLRVVENVELYYTEKSQLKVKMTAPELLEKADGDREFPKGVYMQFFDDAGNLESTLRANHAYYFKIENQWRGRGKVEVRNVASNEQLNTEELFWKPDEERVYNDKFVTIKRDRDVIYGQGIEAKQDMSDYTIINPEGDFDVSEEEETEDTDE